jgi:hypothetical protein
MWNYYTSSVIKKGEGLLHACISSIFMYKYDKGMGGIAPQIYVRTVTTVKLSLPLFGMQLLENIRRIS